MSRRKNDAYFTPEDMVYSFVRVLLDNAWTGTLANVIHDRYKHEYGGQFDLNTAEYILFVEPCAGNGAITNAIHRYMAHDYRKHCPYEILSLDIDPQFKECFKEDFRDFDLGMLVPYLRSFVEDTDSFIHPMLKNAIPNHVHIITNPPYQIEALDRWKHLEPKRRSTTIDGEKVYGPPMINVMAKISEMVTLLDLQSTVGIPVDMSYLMRVTQLEPTKTNAEAMQTLRQCVVLPRLSFTGDGQTDSATTAWFNWTNYHPFEPANISVFSQEML
jgi:hypothetical protein